MIQGTTTHPLTEHHFSHLQSTVCVGLLISYHKTLQEILIRDCLNCISFLHLCLSIPIICHNTKPMSGTNPRYVEDVAAAFSYSFVTVISCSCFLLLTYLPQLFSPEENRDDISEKGSMRICEKHNCLWKGIQVDFSSCS